MEKKLTHSKWFLYLTEFFAGMSVMAVELGASRLLAPYFSSSQIVWTIVIGTIMIAMALACKPDLLLADEPTTALDATIQGQILRLITEQSRKRGMAVLFITHDLGVVARIADNVGVMYAGHLVEHAPTAELFRNPLHPYTRGLMRSAPGRAAMGMQRLPAITGSVPSLDNMPEGCPFAPRCDEALPRCFESAPVARCENGHSVACWAV